MATVHFDSRGIVSNEVKGIILFLRTDACVFDPRIQKETNSLKKNGFSVFVFGWDRKSEYPRREVINNVPYARTRIPGLYGSKLLLIILPLFWIRAIIQMIKIRPNVIHACDLDALVPALFIKMLTPTKVVYDIFDNFADKLSNVPMVLRTLIRTIDQSLMLLADTVIVTDENRRRLLNHPDAQSVHVIMNVPPRLSYEVNSIRQTDCLLVCYAGVIHEHRGLRVIAAALQEVDRIEAKFAGWIPREIDREFLDSQKRIQYLGKVAYEDSLQLLAECDVILALYDPSLPINRMASSNKIYEAMSVRKPVITNKETAMAKVIYEEQCGLLVPYGDKQMLKEALVRLRDEPTFREYLGSNGFNAFVKKYNWDIMEERLIELYTDMLR